MEIYLYVYVNVTSMSKRPDCYECQYRGSVAGSCHSSCTHPAFEHLLKDPKAQVLGMFAQVGRIAPIQAQSEGITVKGNPRGIAHGWFNHPFNFDPLWLEECTGFKVKEGATEE